MYHLTRATVAVGALYYGVSSIFGSSHEGHHEISQENVDGAVKEISKPFRQLLESEHALTKDEMSKKLCTPFDGKTKEICKKILEDESLYQELKKGVKENKLVHLKASSFDHK